MIRAPGSNVRKDNPDEPMRTYQKPAKVIAEQRTSVEAMKKEESTGITRVTRGKMKLKGDGTEDSPMYINFLHSV